MGEALNRSFLPPPAAALCVICVLLLAGCATTVPRTTVIERMTPEQLAALKPAANPALPLAEVVALGKSGMAPAEIIKRLRDTNTIHLLTPQQIVELSRQGVDQSVIDYMADAQERARQSRLLTELADRDAEQARKLEKERFRRRAAEQNFYGYGGYGGLGYPRYGWGAGYPYPYGRFR